MYDMLPFPNITSRTVEGQIAEINSYLIQFKESLEFILSGIGVENLSPELVGLLNSLGSEIEKTNKDKEEELNQVSNNTAYKFTVNFETGNLEYTR